MAASGSEDAVEAARAIEVHGRGGLAKLGLGRGGEEIAAVGDAQVVSLRIRNLTLPLAGHRPLGAAGGGADQPRRPAPAGRLRAAPLRDRHHPPLGAGDGRGLGADLRQPGPGAAGADQPPRPHPEHHPDPRDPDARRRRRAGAAGRRALRLRRGDRGRGAQGPGACCASTPTTRRRSSACSATGRGAATCATSTARWRRSRSTRRAWLLGELDTTPKRQAVVPSRAQPPLEDLDRELR